MSHEPLIAMTLRSSRKPAKLRRRSGTRHNEANAILGDVGLRALAFLDAETCQFISEVPGSARVISIGQRLRFHLSQRGQTP
jgi:hypothetical protein